MADLEQRVRDLSQCLQENNLTVSSYGYVISSKKLAHEQSSLAQQAISIYETFYRYLLRRPSVTSWALKIAKDALGQDVSNLVQAQHRLHFNAKHTTSNYLVGLFMKEAITNAKACSS